MEEVDGKRIEYWNCPSKFIPQSIHQWYNIYKYHHDFPGAAMKGAHEQTPRFLKAYYYYDSWLSQFKKEMSK